MAALRSFLQNNAQLCGEVQGGRGGEQQKGSGHVVGRAAVLEDSGVEDAPLSGTNPAAAGKGNRAPGLKLCSQPVLSSASLLCSRRVLGAVGNLAKRRGSPEGALAPAAGGCSLHLALTANGREARHKANVRQEQDLRI